MAIVLQIPGWTIPISDDFIENLFYQQDESTTVVELSPSIIDANFW